ncbi:MAG: NAD(P)-dependent oxidoreductase [Desulfuromonadaceae bacterium]|nr:NAD(P)-dependent oxidoreductase [Desulfuromonadaceae bacterium]MDD2853935.1 NAD(P)-dependent oxidoreductase [Desulfuromonadaceae bacterium]
MSENKRRTAVVSGATGFIGGHLAHTLVNAGWNLHIIVQPKSDLKPLAELLPEIHVHIHDGSTAQLMGIIGDSSPDVVFHLASLFLAQHSPSNIEQLVRSNVTFATQLTEAMIQAGCHCLINTGTSWQHYENGEYNPVNLYSASKQAFEAMLIYYLATSPLKAVTLKLFDTYGPNDPRPKLFTLLRPVAAEGKPLAMSAGKQLIDLVYIDDVVQAYLIAAERLLAGQVSGNEHYAVSSGRPLPLRDLVDIYGRLIGAELPIEWGAREYRQREVMIPWQKGKRLPGWQPEVELTEGIARMILQETKECRINQ